MSNLNSAAYKQGYEFPVDDCPYTSMDDIREWQHGVEDSLIDEMADSDSGWFE